MQQRTLLLICIMFLAFGSNAQHNGWKKLFNGKDLQGWKQLNGKAKYEVKNGEIVGTTVMNEPNSFFGDRRRLRKFYS